jgi:aminopeptidase N
MDTSFPAISSWFVSGETTLPAQKLNYRLPTDLLPIHYDLWVKFQFVETYRNNSFPYDGEIKIQINCVKDTSKLILHVKNLVLDNTTLLLRSSSDNSFGELKEFSWYNDYTRQFFIADLPKQLKAGNTYEFSVKYTGYLQDDDRGFYRSSYMKNGVRTWLATSQLESTDARKSFPCFDEPAMKASFSVKIVHQSDYFALSNMDVKSITEL